MSAYASSTVSFHIEQAKIANRTADTFAGDREAMEKHIQEAIVLCNSTEDWKKQKENITELHAFFIELAKTKKDISVYLEFYITGINAAFEHKDLTAAQTHLEYAFALYSHIQEDAYSSHEDSTRSIYLKQLQEFGLRLNKEINAERKQKKEQAEEMQKKLEELEIAFETPIFREYASSMSNFIKEINLAITKKEFIEAGNLIAAANDFLKSEKDPIVFDGYNTTLIRLSLQLGELTKCEPLSQKIAEAKTAIDEGEFIIAKEHTAEAFSLLTSINFSMKIDVKTNYLKQLEELSIQIDNEMTYQRIFKQISDAQIALSKGELENARSHYEEANSDSASLYFLKKEKGELLQMLLKGLSSQLEAKEKKLKETENEQVIFSIIADIKIAIHKYDEDRSGDLKEASSKLEQAELFCQDVQNETDRDRYKQTLRTLKDSLRNKKLEAAEQQRGRSSSIGSDFFRSRLSLMGGTSSPSSKPTSHSQGSTPTSKRWFEK